MHKRYMIVGLLCALGLPTMMHGMFKARFDQAWQDFGDKVETFGGVIEEKAQNFVNNVKPKEQPVKRKDELLKNRVQRLQLKKNDNNNLKKHSNDLKKLIKKRNDTGIKKWIPKRVSSLRMTNKQLYAVCCMGIIISGCYWWKKRNIEKNNVPVADDLDA